MSKLSRVKMPNDLFKKIATLMLDTLRIDDYTKDEIRKNIIDKGYYSYISLIRKYSDFLTPIRLMVLVDHVNILDAFKYYLQDYNSSKYEKINSNHYNLVTGLQVAELKLITLEQLYEIFGQDVKIGVMFHEKNEKFDAIIEINETKKINLTDNEGYIYVSLLQPGTYAFESRACSSVNDTDSIIEARQNYKSKFEKYFLVIPRDANIEREPNSTLEKNNIRLMFSNYSTIDIVNDVAYMQGILKKDI